MKILIAIPLFLLCLVSCETKDNYIDTGVSNGVHECSMMAYLESDSYNWDSTVIMIERAGLVSIFDGTDPNYEQITFLGPTNHTIRRWMIEKGYSTVNDIRASLCDSMIMKHVINERFMKADVDFQNTAVDIFDSAQDGGTHFTTEDGSPILAYRLQKDYNGVSGAGAIVLRMVSLNYYQKVPVASPDIQCNNGVVHSLNYSYKLGEL